MIALTAFISTLSGLWGVLVTDLFQFVDQDGMVIVLAVCAVQRGRRHRCDEDEAGGARRGAPRGGSVV